MNYRSLKNLFFALCVLMCIITIFIIKYNHSPIKLLRKNGNEVIKLENTQKYSYFNQWKYICSPKNICTRIPIKSKIKGHTLETCEMICGKPKLWPMPKYFEYNQTILTPFHINDMSLNYNFKITPVGKLLKKAYGIFYKNIEKITSDQIKNINSLKHLIIKIQITDTKTTDLRLNISESYKITSQNLNENVTILIESITFFGARHGLETLSQLIWFDDVEKSLMILHNIKIIDEPAFPYRGFMLDTSRNYFSLNTIKRNLRGMAANKLNVFHWHLTDSQSFPFISTQFPKLGQFGAYNNKKIYTTECIKKIIEYAKPLGIRVIIEIDSPSHMLEGWRQINKDFVIELGNGTGKINPKNKEVFQLLEILYKEIYNLTQDKELMHIGGDEINIDSFLGESFNLPSFEKFCRETILKIINLARSTVQYVILWSNDLIFTEEFTNLVKQSNIIVQFWYGYTNYLEQFEYKIIFSDVDAWYLDCGYGNWAAKTEYNEQSCYYNSWYKIYSHRPWKFMDLDRVMGGEICMWSENVGESSLDQKVWPRSAAFAEAVWSAPEIRLNAVDVEVYGRLDLQTRRLKKRGIKSGIFWPEWCTKRPGFCT